MPSFDIVRKSEFVSSFRTESIIGAFDIDTGKLEERFTGRIDIDDMEWNIGLIVGGSGTGKSTIARELFPDDYIRGYEYSASSVIDDMPKDASIKDIELAFTGVGFASPPSWLKPYAVLSNVEQMWVDLARAMLENRELFVFDEFTSVVNREVAKTGSLAIAKAVRKKGKRFIAVSCHDDIIEWLQADWIYNTDEKRFFVQRESSIARNSSLRYTGLATSIKEASGRYSGSIII